MLSRLKSLWRNLWHRDRVDGDLDTEVRAVYDLLVDEKIRSGLSPERARRAATLELGRVDAITQQVRESRSGAAVEAIVKDVRYGARVLRANPGFTAVVVLSLAAGIGANTAIFSVANALLLRTLPVPDPDQVYQVQFESRLPMVPRFSYRVFETLRDSVADRITDRTADGAGLAAMSRVARMRAQQGGGEIEPANVQLVSGEYFGVLRLQPALGRFFSPDDNRSLGGHPLAVISDAFWRRRFDASPGAVGREFTLNSTRFTVIGVAPPGFAGVWLESPVDAWIPLMMQADVRYTQNWSGSGTADPNQPWVPQADLRWVELLTRADRPNGPQLAALNGVFRPVAMAEAEAATDPDERAQALDTRLSLQSFAHGSSGLRGQFRAPLFALMAMVGVLLLIACANTANLLLARATNRQREMALRLSIGASRGRVMTQLMIEGLLLGLLAGALGLAIAPLASELLVRMTMGLDAGPLPFSVGIDTRVLIFTAGIALVTSFLFSFAPAWRATDLSLSQALKTGGRSTHFGARLNLSKLLVIAQVALSLLLAVGAGLFARSFGNLAALPLGFEPRVLWVSINPSVGGYSLAELPGLYRRLIDRAEALPGVESATLAMCGLMTGCRSSGAGIAITGYQPQPGEQVVFLENRVADSYFRTVGMTIMAGRDFTPFDSTSNAKAVIINESAARKYFAGRDAVGQHIGFDAPTHEIVGVVRDARVLAVREEAAPMWYFPLDSTPSYVGSMHVRTTADPDVTAAELRRAFREIEPKLPVDRVAPVVDLAAATLRQDRLIARLTIVLGSAALALACLGLYGLMSYAVRQRTAELGIRFALGAPRVRVLWMVFRESLLLMLAGLAIGVPMILAASRLIGTLLFGISGSDPLTIAAAMAALTAVGAASSYWPALRASRVDPLIALREE